MKKGNYIDDPVVKVWELARTYFLFFYKNSPITNGLFSVLHSLLYGNASFGKSELFCSRYAVMFSSFTICFQFKMEGTKGQFHVADQHTDYMIPNELFQTTIKAFGHCEGISEWMFFRRLSKLESVSTHLIFIDILTFYSTLFIANEMTDNCEAGYTMLKCFTVDNSEFWFN